MTQDTQIRQVERERVEEIADDALSGTVEADGPVSVDGGGLQNVLADAADSLDVTGFKCVKCSLQHGHDTNKHRSSDTFDVSESEAAKMDYNPNCHCGVNELARHGSDYGVDEASADSTASSAPIPDETRVQMDEQYGA